MNNELDVTRFINIDDEDFTCHLNNQPIEFKAGEEKIKPIYVAKHCAKHLIDRILQKKNLRLYYPPDNPVRQNLMVKILPDLAEEAGVKPLSTEEEMSAMKTEMEKQQKLIDTLLNKPKDENVSELTKKLNKALEEIESLKKGQK